MLTAKPPKRIRATNVTLQNYATGRDDGKYSVSWWPAAKAYRVIGLDNTVNTIVNITDVRGLLTANNIAAAAAEKH